MGKPYELLIFKILDFLAFGESLGHILLPLIGWFKRGKFYLVTFKSPKFQQKTAKCCSLGQK